MTSDSDRLYTASFLLMGLSYFFCTASMSSFFLFSLYVDHLGGDKVQIGLLMGAAALASVLCRPWISGMIDKIGRKKTYSLGCLFMFLLPLIYYAIPADLDRFFPALLGVRIAHGVALALCFTSAFTYIADVVPTGRMIEGLGMFGTTGLSGMAAGPMVGEFFINGFGYQVYFLSGAGLAFAAMLCQAPLKEKYIRIPGLPSASFFSVLARAKILSLAFIALLFGMGLGAYGGFVSPYAKSLNISLISAYFIAYSAAAVMTRLFGGRLADRVGGERIVPYALVVTGIGFLWLIFVQGTLSLVLSGLVTGTGHGFLFPCLNALALSGEPQEIRGKINGVFTGGIDAGVFSGSIVLGYVGEIFGYQAIFLVAGLALFCGLIAFKAGVKSRS